MSSSCARICRKSKAKRDYYSSSGRPRASTPLERPPRQWQRPCHHRRQHNPTATTPPARHNNTTSLQSKTARARCKRHWRAPCTVGQRNGNVLNLSKGTFKHLVKIREPSVSFNFAESQQKMSFELNKRIDGTGNWHREHAGPLALEMVSSKDAKEGAKSPAACTISV